MSGARWIQPTSFHPVHIRSILVSFQLKVFQVTYSSVQSSPTKDLYKILFSLICAKFLAYFTAIDLFIKGFLTMKPLNGNRKSKFPQDTILCCKVYILMCIEYHWFCETSVTRGRYALDMSWGIQFLQGMAFGLNDIFYQPAGVRPQRLILLLNLEQPFPWTSAWKWRPWLIWSSVWGCFKNHSHSGRLQ